MKSLSQLKKMSPQQLVDEFSGSSFPFDFAECFSCLLQHGGGDGIDTPCGHLSHDCLSLAVRELMKNPHGKSLDFGDRIKANLIKLYKLRVKYASLFPTPVPTKFPRPKKKKPGWKLKEAAPSIHSIYKQSISNSPYIKRSMEKRSAQIGILR